MTVTCLCWASMLEIRYEVTDNSDANDDKNQQRTIRDCIGSLALYWKGPNNLTKTSGCIIINWFHQPKSGFERSYF